MFAIISRGRIIGRSALERGDPSMGVAFGLFVPASAFGWFLATVPPSREDAGVQIWSGLSTTDPDGIALDCLGVGLFRYDRGVGLDVEVLGVDRRRYEVLFPHHVEAEERRFSPSVDDA